MDFALRWGLVLGAGFLLLLGAVFIELFIIRSQTAASGRPTTIHGTIIEPSQRSGLSVNGTYLTGMNPMPVTAMPAPKSSSIDSPTT